MNRLASRLLLCLLAVCALPSLCAAQKSPTPAVWKPDSKLLAQLGPEVSVGDYKIRPPKGYAIFSMHHDTVKTLGWRGALQKDDISPICSLTILPTPEGIPTETLQQTMQSAQKSLKANASEKVFGNTENGVINGVPFLRTHWTGHYNNPNIAAQGIFYAGMIGRTVFFIDMQDSAPYSINILPLLEAAALTFRKG